MKVIAIGRAVLVVFVAAVVLVWVVVLAQGFFGAFARIDTYNSGSYQFLYIGMHKDDVLSAAQASGLVTTVGGRVYSSAANTIEIDASTSEEGADNDVQTSLDRESRQSKVDIQLATMSVEDNSTLISMDDWVFRLPSDKYEGKLARVDCHFEDDSLVKIVVRHSSFSL